MSYLNQKAVKDYFKGHGKQLSREGLQALEDSMPVVLGRVVAAVGHFKRIKETEVFMALGRREKV